MRKISTIVLFLALLITPMPTQAKTCTCGNPYCVYKSKTEKEACKRLKQYIKDTYWEGKYKNFKIKFISPDKLTYKKLVNRKRNKIIYIEVSDGYVMKTNSYEGITHDGYYISYKGVNDQMKKGTKVRTYCIYNPDTTYEDDIIYRSDRVLNTKRNRKPIKAAEKNFKKNFGVSYYDEVLNY